MTTRTALPDLMDMHDLMELTGLGRTATYDLTKRPDFPMPYTLGPKTLRWDRQAVAGWLDQVHTRATRIRADHASAPSKNKPKSFTIDGVTFRSPR